MRAVRVIWSWREANNIARAFAVVARKRYRAKAYRTGIPTQAWGYAIEEAT